MTRVVSGRRAGAGTTAGVAWLRVHAKQGEDAAWSLGARLCGRRVCGALCLSRRVGVADALPASGGYKGCCGPSSLGGHGGMRGEGFCVPFLLRLPGMVRRICEGASSRREGRAAGGSQGRASRVAICGVSPGVQRMSMCKASGCSRCAARPERDTLGSRRRPPRGVRASPCVLPSAIGVGWPHPRNR